MPEEIDAGRLIADCQRGSSEAWARLVELQYGVVFAAARRLTGNDRAEDITQGFFLYAIEHRLIQKFRGDSLVSLTAFFRSCLRNYIKQELRRPVREEPLESMDGFAVLNQLDPHDEIVSRENLEKIQKAYESLRLEYKQILELEARSYKHREIAEMLGMPLGTVSVYSRRAREQLQAHLRAAHIMLACAAAAIAGLQTLWQGLV